MTANAKPIVIVKDLTVGYGDTIILKDINFEIHTGEIFGILGGSGCGKSTLLKHCIGLSAPAGGAVRLLGAELAQIEGRPREQLLARIGVLFQYGALLGSLTIGENVALPLQEHSDLPAEVIRELVRLKLALVELSHAENLLPSELSGGMRKRAALARAMALDPQLLFCDEPSAGLDPLTSAELDALLMRLRDRFGMGMVVVTHELASMEKITDLATLISSGKVIADGTLAEVKASPHPEIRAFFERIAAGELRRDKTALELLSEETWP
ncbi:MAG: ATP-binding cassette domain-containing protein [Deltaproteobacteria bacterium]|nr:ATP-binding cassette domain-containing protein [Deltaproteobacteria bacterium]